MNVLVTGGAGFIGSHVVDKLLARGDDVTCIDNIDPYYSPAEKKKNIERNIRNPRFHFTLADVQNQEEVLDSIRNREIDRIVHLAAKAGVRASIEQPAKFFNSNMDGTSSVLEIARIAGINKVVYASSSSVYGNSGILPFRESQDTDKPISPYAATKKAGEIICAGYSHSYGLDISCLRFFTVYGPRGRPDMAPRKFMELIEAGKPIQIYGDWEKSGRDYTYVGDIADGVISALDRVNGFDIFNLGNSTPILLRRFVETLEEKMGKKAQIDVQQEQKGDVLSTWADITHARDILGYNPKTTINEGLGEMIQWYRSSKQ